MRQRSSPCAARHEHSKAKSARERSLTCHMRSEMSAIAGACRLELAFALLASRPVCSMVCTSVSNRCRCGTTRTVHEQEITRDSKIEWKQEGKCRGERASVACGRSRRDGRGPEGPPLPLSTLVHALVSGSPVRLSWFVHDRGRLRYACGPVSSNKKQSVAE
jgi:hypothetical protein